MKPKDPIWNFYSALNDKKNTSVRCLDCSAEVSAKLLRLMISTFGRDEIVHFMNTKTWPNIMSSQKHNHLKIPIDHSN